MRNTRHTILQIKIKINTDMPVQVDGEPWIQSPGEVVIMKSALKVSVAINQNSALQT